MAESTEYQVLARKYRPSDFTTLIGQDAMVQTLRNAIDSDRLAHAFIMTGVRGVGKTTTARIIAKGLNCLNSDGPTVEPCGVCDACVAISESRFIDVIEMDAASRTGIDDIREIIESVRYAPQSARFKVYIIDEVHMLSNQAFNGLLKTLEEPPPHVKFIFATTEIRKLPVTVLSRCQRFDLRRVEMPTLINHLERILGAEKVDFEADALSLIARAAEGSVRDSLSLLDQAIAHGGGTVSLAQVHDMLGFADRNQIIALFKAVMGGTIEEAVTQMKSLYDRGADPVQVISDLLEVCHAVTRFKVATKAGADDALSDAEHNAISDLAKSLMVPELTRAWQLLLKGLGEVKSAPKPQMAADMVLVRLAHAATLPDPAALVKKLEGTASSAASSNAPQTNSPSGSGGGGGGGPLMPGNNTTHMSSTPGFDNGAAVGQSGRNHAPTGSILAFKQDTMGGPSAPHPMPLDFEAMVQLFRNQREVVIATMLKDRVKLVAYKPGHIEIEMLRGAPQTLPSDMKRKLSDWTGNNWQVSIATSGSSNSDTLRTQEEKEQIRLVDQAKADPLVKAMLIAFPDAEIRTVKKRSEIDTPAADNDVTGSRGSEMDIDEVPVFEDDTDDFEFED